MSLLSLPHPTTITPAVITDKITLLQLQDCPAQRSVIAIIKEIPFLQLTLWEGDAYDDIGDWTQQQAETRIVTLLTTTPPPIT